MHVEKYKAFQVAPLALHWCRMRGDGSYSNESIDPARTPLNYDLSERGDESVTDRLARVLSEVESATGRKVRKDAVACFDTVVTLTRDWPEGRDPREFFQAVYDTFSGWLGPQNILCACVHMDETTPHVHIAAVPRTKDGRICYKDVMPRKTYARLHEFVRRAVLGRTGLDLAFMLDPAEKVARAGRGNDQAIFKEAQSIVRAEAEAARAEASALDEKICEAQKNLETKLWYVSKETRRLEALQARVRDAEQELGRLGDTASMADELARVTRERDAALSERRTLSALLDALWALVHELLRRVMAHEPDFARSVRARLAEIAPGRINVHREDDAHER